MSKAISILTPVFNGEKFVTRCYRNILDQTVSDWEWIVVDDGSTDSTVELLCNLNDSRIRIISYPINQGRGFARNIGLQFAQGEWIACFDIDDLQFPRKLEMVLERCDSEVDFFCSYGVLVDNNLAVKGVRGYSNPSNVYPRGFLHPTLVCRAKVIRSIMYSMNPGPGGPGEDAKVIWTLGAKYKGLWIEDALTAYQEDREVNLKKAFWSNVGHLITLVKLRHSPLSRKRLFYIFEIGRYSLKLAILFALSPFPRIYARSVVFRNNGAVQRYWGLSEADSDYLARFRNWSGSKGGTR